MTGTNTSESLLVELPESLTIAQGSEVRETLESAVTAGSPHLELRAANVQRCDTAGVQLLVSMVRSLRERRIEWTWVEVSRTLDGAARSLGLTDELALDRAANSEND